MLAAARVLSRVEARVAIGKVEWAMAAVAALVVTTVARVEIEVAR